MNVFDVKVREVENQIRETPKRASAKLRQLNRELELWNEAADIVSDIHFNYGPRGPII